MARTRGKKIYVKKEPFQEAMLRAGHNVPSLSKELFVSRQALHFAINRVNGLSPATAKKALELLGKEFDDLFEIV